MLPGACSLTGRVLTRATPREKRRVFDMRGDKSRNVVDGDSGERGHETARETAGLAKELEEVKYAAVITKPTARSPVARQISSSSAI